MCVEEKERIRGSDYLLNEKRRRMESSLVRCAGYLIELSMNEALRMTAHYFGSELGDQAKCIVHYPVGGKCSSSRMIGLSLLWLSCWCRLIGTIETNAA